MEVDIRLRTTLKLRKGRDIANSERRVLLVEAHTYRFLTK